MARALGFHLRGEKVNYALVDRDPEEGIVVLAAGETTTEAVNFLYQKLSGGRPLPWAVARFKEGNPIPQLPQSWTLGRPAPQALLQPSTAAAWLMEDGFEVLWDCSLDMALINSTGPPA